MVVSAAAQIPGESGGPAVLAGILGATSCADCHGGAAENNRQFLVWSQRDAHSRSYATLVTARSARMAEALGIEKPSESPRCTACHAPLQTVSAARLAPDARVTEGVSCASCHGFADDWLRSHTRADFTHQDRVTAGMRELRDPYHRANACVACHQNIDPAIVNVGKHPALLFELDGQTQSEPKHWREAPGHDGAQSWFVGQAVALREMSAALRDGRIDAKRELPRWQALVWVLQRANLDTELAQFNTPSSAAEAATFSRVATLSDGAAQRVSTTWNAAHVKAALARLAATSGDFLTVDVPTLAQACRAERLVLALDRLLAALPVAERSSAASARLDELFHLVQSQPDFKPIKFAEALAVFAKTIGN
jgi:hypothetical protein